MHRHMNCVPFFARSISTKFLSKNCQNVRFLKTTQPNTFLSTLSSQRFFRIFIQFFTLIWVDTSPVQPYRCFKDKTCTWQIISVLVPPFSSSPVTLLSTWLWDYFDNPNLSETTTLGVINHYMNCCTMFIALGTQVASHKFVVHQHL